MSKNKQEICRLALEEMSILGVGQDMPDDYYQRALSRLEALYDEARTWRGVVVDWTLDAVPEQYSMPLAVALGGYIGRLFGRPVTEQDKRAAVGELKAALIPDDREEYRPEAEVKAAAFF